MKFRMDCNNRGCGESQEPFLDRDTNQVFCSVCGKEISNVSPFAKNAMRQNKQFRPKVKKGFMVKCPCGVEDTPKLVGGHIVCASCGKTQTQLTPPFIALLREKLKEED
jgi:hypothetical protein